MEIEADGLVFKHLELARFLYSHIVLLFYGQVRALPWASKSAFMDIAAIDSCSYSNAPDSIVQVRFDPFPHFMG